MKALLERLATTNCTAIKAWPMSALVADPPSIGRTLTLINGALAPNDDSTIGALTQMGGAPATFTLPSAILQAASERISSKSHLRGEPSCR
jgi:hypothetical protein